MGGSVEVVIPYCPREQFQTYHDRLTRWAFLLAHRRAGKTVATINDLIRKASSNDSREARYAYIAPYHNQAKDIAWVYLKRYTAPLAAFGGKINESELSVVLPRGQGIRLYGAENGERIRGIGLDGAVLDEYANFPPHLWGEVIRPALSDRQGWATFIGTAKGRMNDFYRRHEEARSNPDWYYNVLKASETGIFPQSELDSLRKQMTADEYEQEYECSFEAAIKGAVFAAELSAMRDTKRIGRVPYDPALPVQTWWDLGIGDSTAIGFVQVVNAEVRAIDYYEASGEGLPHYAKVLNDKGYVYGRHLAPHDIAVRELGSGRSRIETAASLGIKFDICPNVPLEDGIHAARLLLPRMWFDEQKCQRWLDALANYRWAENKQLHELKATPVHDWSSHAADMTRYGALALKDHKEKKTNAWKVEPLGDRGWMR